MNTEIIAKLVALQGDIAKNILGKLAGDKAGAAGDLLKNILG